MVNTTELVAKINTDLNGLTRVHRIAFAAACVERIANGFLDADDGRPEDDRLFRESIEFMWTVDDSDRQLIEDYRERLTRFPEIADEDEAEDRAFYAECAVVALLYALDVAAGLEGAAVNLMKRMHHMADALDLDLGTDGTNLQAELACQRRDVSTLLKVATLAASDLLEIRSRAIQDREALGAAFSRVPS
jgi:hypothetical protein